MVIEIREKGSKEFYEELVNVTGQYRSLIKKPDRKIKNSFRSLRLYMILCAVFLAVLLLMAVFWGTDTMMTVGIVLMVIVIALCGAFLHNMNSVVKGYLADERHSTLTLDENGVELSKNGANTVRLAWDNVAFVRAFDESVCFFTKDITGFIISVNSGHRKEILDYLTSAGIPVKVIA